MTRAVWLARGSFPWLVDDARDRGPGRGFLLSASHKVSRCTPSHRTAGQPREQGLVVASRRRPHTKGLRTGPQLGSLTTPPVSALPIGHIVRASTSCERLGGDSSRDRGSSTKHHGRDVDQEDAPGREEASGYKCIY